MDSGKWWNALGAIGTWVMGGAMLYFTLNPPSNHAAGGFPWPPVLFGLTLLSVGAMQIRAAQINREASRTHGALSASPQESLPGREMAGPHEERIFVQKRPYELTRAYDQLTSYQAKKLTDDYVGKWVRWKLKVTNVHAPQGGFVEAITVLAWAKNEEDVGVTVALDFDPPQHASVTHLSKDTMIEVEGQISSLYSATVFLNHCKVVA